jgi:glycosyltransferase involved in cell wall biosynthesis
MTAFPGPQKAARSPAHDESSADRPNRHVCILFHESAILGAGVSVLRALGHLRAQGWRSSGWFPGPGPLVIESGAVLDRSAHATKPIAFSLRGWRREPGIARRLRRTPAYLRALERWLRETEPDVVHVNSLLMLPEATVARRLGLPIVVQVHELPASGRKRDLALRWAAAVADVLIGVSRPVTRMLVQRAGQTPVVTVYNGVPTVEARQPPAGDFVVGTVGHVSRTKGTDVFLEAAALALVERPALRFEHVGPTRPWQDDEFEDRVERMAEAPPMRGSLAMLGQRPAHEALASWSVFVLASRQEAFPLSTLEAMAVGVPVIATNVGGVPEQIAHLESGVLVQPDDPQAIADWIGRLHDDAELRARLAAGGRLRVRSAFTLEAQAEGLQRAYEVAVSR